MVPSTDTLVGTKIDGLSIKCKSEDAKSEIFEVKSTNFVKESTNIDNGSTNVDKESTNVVLKEEVDVKALRTTGFLSCRGNDTQSINSCRVNSTASLLSIVSESASLEESSSLLKEGSKSKSNFAPMHERIGDINIISSCSNSGSGESVSALSNDLPGCQIPVEKEETTECKITSNALVSCNNSREESEKIVSVPEQNKVNKSDKQKISIALLTGRSVVPPSPISEKVTIKSSKMDAIPKLVPSSLVVSPPFTSTSGDITEFKEAVTNIHTTEILKSKLISNVNDNALEKRCDKHLMNPATASCTKANSIPTSSNEMVKIKNIPSVEKAKISNQLKIGSIMTVEKDNKDNTKPKIPILNPLTPPLKSTTMSHLRTKYMTELEYMLHEFKKLECQLLSAKKGEKESAGSRERREKLHTFILYLEDTMEQIQIGYGLEVRGKSTLSITVSSLKNGAGTRLPCKVSLDHLKLLKGDATGNRCPSPSTLPMFTNKKDEEENVQKIEEHVLTNLLPVKIRLSKQLAAQKGAATNPAGMPTSRQGMLQPTVEKGVKGTFAAAAEQNRLTHFQKNSCLQKYPSLQVNETNLLQKKGSSLTQNLHGAKLGSTKRQYGQDAYTPNATLSKASLTTSSSYEGNDIKDDPSTISKKRPILYAGMALGSDQVVSGVSAAAGVHDMMIESPIMSATITADEINDIPYEDQMLQNEETFIDPTHYPSKPPALPAITQPKAPNLKEIACSIVSNKYNTYTQSPKSSATSPKILGPTGKSIIQEKETSLHTKLTAPPLQTSKTACTMPPPRHRALHVAQPLQHLGINHTKISSTQQPLSMTVIPKQPLNSLKDPNLTEEELQEIKRRRRRKQKEKRRQMELDHQRQFVIHQQQQQRQQQQQAATIIMGPRRNVNACTPHTRGTEAHRKGPRSVEYICSLCNEPYNSTCDCNPWWALTSHDCGKCGKTQIPRIDISAPANTIKYHPALLAHAIVDTNRGNVSNSGVDRSIVADLNIRNGQMSSTYSQFSSNPTSSHKPIFSGTAESLTHCNRLDLSDIEDEDMSFSDSDESEYGTNMSYSSKVENEDFGKHYSGPKHSDYDASRLLHLINHASTCTGFHKNKRTRDVCQSTKLLMLHVRDCPGTTAMYDVCPFPWCRKTKHLLYHLISCTDPLKCEICSPINLSNSMKILKSSNERQIKQKRILVTPAVSQKSQTPQTKIITKIKAPHSVPNIHNTCNTTLKAKNKWMPTQPSINKSLPPAPSTLVGTEQYTVPSPLHVKQPICSINSTIKGTASNDIYALAHNNISRASESQSIVQTQKIPKHSSTTTSILNPSNQGILFPNSRFTPRDRQSIPSKVSSSSSTIVLPPSINSTLNSSLIKQAHYSSAVPYGVSVSHARNFTSSKPTPTIEARNFSTPKKNMIGSSHKNSTASIVTVSTVMKKETGHLANDCNKKKALLNPSKQSLALTLNSNLKPSVSNVKGNNKFNESQGIKKKSLHPLLYSNRIICTNATSSSVPSPIMVDHKGLNGSKVK